MIQFNATRYLNLPFAQTFLYAVVLSMLLGTPAFALRSLDNNARAMQKPSLVPRLASAVQRDAAATAAHDGVAIQWDRRLGTPFSVRGVNLGMRRAFSGGVGLVCEGRGNYAGDAIAVLDNLSPVFGVFNAKSEFAATSVEADRLAFHHVRLKQMYQGLHVLGGNLIVHFNAHNNVYEVNGQYVADIRIDTTPKIVETKAIEIAKNDLLRTTKENNPSITAPTLLVFAFHAAPALAYQITLCYESASGTPGRWKYFINAINGEILLRYNEICTIAAPTTNGTPATISGSLITGEGGGTTNVTGWFQFNNNSYYLYNTNLFWYVYNVSTKATYSDYNTYAYRVSNTWGATDRSEMSLANNFTIIQDYFKAVHGRSSFDNSNAFARANVHEGNNYVNAFWDGIDFHFGDGDGYNANALVTLDISAHEATHGVTQYSSELIYADESGVLNESFSDVLGACVEFYGQPDGRSAYPGKVAGHADWLLAEDCWLANPAMRDMRNPTNAATVGASNRQPSRYKGTYWDPFNEVHQNDSVQNFFFYLLCEGGSGNNEGITYNVPGINITNAQYIAYRALTVYCTPSTDYRAVRGAWLSAAHDLNSNWVASVRSAWSAVGIDTLIIYPDPGLAFIHGFGESNIHYMTINNVDPELPAPWAATNMHAWATLAPASGIVPPNGSMDVCITIDAALPSGDYVDAITFSNLVNGATQMRSVAFKIIPPIVYTYALDANPGWTAEGQWQYGKPQGLGYDNGYFHYFDPLLGYTGTNVYGYNLAGNYGNRMTTTLYLTTAAIDCYGYSNVTLSFWRWLVVDAWVSDRANIQVSADGLTWTNIYDNHYGDRDTSWKPMIYNIARVADNQPTVYVRWGMGPTDSGVEYPGWNIDDIAVHGTAVTVPPRAQAVSATRGEYIDKVRVWWNVVPAAETYQLFRNSAPNTNGATLIADAISVTNLDDTNVMPEHTYYYSLRTYNSNGWSAFAWSSGYASFLPPFIDITNCAGLVKYGASSFVVKGTNVNVAGQIACVNHRHTDATNVVAAAAGFSVTCTTIEEGDNYVSVSGTNKYEVGASDTFTVHRESYAEGLPTIATNALIFPSSGSALQEGLSTNVIWMIAGITDSYDSTALTIVKISAVTTTTFSEVAVLTNNIANKRGNVRWRVPTKLTGGLTNYYLRFDIVDSSSLSNSLIFTANPFTVIPEPMALACMLLSICYFGRFR